MSNRKLGDKINRGFVIIVLILGVAMIVRGLIGFKQYDRSHTFNYEDFNVDATNDSSLFSIAWEEAAAWYEVSPFDLTYTKYEWYYDITNPDNAECVTEVAFNLDIPFDSVTQKQFNNRYQH